MRVVEGIAPPWATLPLGSISSLVFGMSWNVFATTPAHLGTYSFAHHRRVTQSLVMGRMMDCPCPSRLNHKATAPRFVVYLSVDTDGLASRKRSGPPYADIENWLVTESGMDDQAKGILLAALRRLPLLVPEISS